MFQKKSGFMENGGKEEIVYIQYSVFVLFFEYLHISRAVLEGDQPGCESAHEQQVEVVEWKYPQEAPAIELYEISPHWQGSLHVDQYASDQKT